MVIGLLMIIVPQWAFHVIITVLLGGAVVFQLIHTAKRLKKSQWNFERERMRFYILAILATIFLIVLMKQQAMAVFGSGIAGGWLLVTAYRSFLAFKRNKNYDFLFWKNLVKTILYACCGIMIVFVPSELLVWIVLALGIIMVIDGVCTIIYSIIQANEKYSAVYDKVKQKVSIKKK